MYRWLSVRPTASGFSPRGRRWLFSNNTSYTLLLDANGNRRQVIYKGPVNSLMSKLKLASVVGAGGGAAIGPLVLHYLQSESWPLTSSLLFTGCIAAVSAGQFFLVNRVLKRYVLRGYQLVVDDHGSAATPPLSPEDQLVELETMDWLGRVQRRAIFMRDLQVYGPAELMCKSTGQRFALCTQECMPSASPLLKLFKS